MKLKGATIPDAIVERVIARRGAEHCFADLDPARTALVVIDLQHAFMTDGVGHAVCPAARDIVPAVNRLAAAVRAAGGGVFWVQMTHDERCLDEWSVAHEMASPEMREKRDRRPLRRDARPSAVARSRRAAGRRDRQQIPLQRLYAGDLGLARAAAGARLRHRADHRDRHQCLLRKLGARRQHDELPHDHGQRRQRREHPGGARRLAQPPSTTSSAMSWTPT